MLPRCTARAAQDLIMRRTPKRFLFFLKITVENQHASDTLIHDTTVRLIKERANEPPLAPAVKHKLELAGALMAFYTSLTRLNVGTLKDKVYPANM